MFRFVALVLAILCLPILCHAADWPQWRGPSRNCVAPDSPALLDEFPKEGPKKLWQSEAIPGSQAGGYGSCAVADGKVYLYVNRCYESPKRILTAGALNAAGYAPDMPATLSQTVEETRTSAARTEIKDTKVLDPWITHWIKDNVKPEDKKFAAATQVRLRAGADAIPLEVLAKLKPIQDQTFDTQAQLDAWFKTSQIAEKVAKQVSRIMVPVFGESEDLVYCLDAGTGKTLWKTPIDSKWLWDPCSTTPAIADGKCYVWNSQGRVHCLDAKDGKELWKSESQGGAGFRHNRSSSVLLIDGLAVVEGENALCAFNAQDGKLAWSLKQFPSEQGSATAWMKDGKNYILVNAGDQLACLEPKDGKMKWTARSGPSYATPSTDGDFAALCAAGSGVGGLIGYTLSADDATEAWKVPFKDTHAGLIIKDGYVYAIGDCEYQGRRYQQQSCNDRGNGRAMCIEQKSGQIAWEQPVGSAQYSTPLLADGKIVAVNGRELLVFKATPDKFTPVGNANLGLERWSSPAFADGKVFLRTAGAVVCYDLRK
jgi:outer membrane protein assembly factor BamB